ncbi:uncharacterized protein RSE6_05603 [Rhynchosporium secalis]|uniref:Uncharacterized protein n=1 Tax=Rhynchosporium secalis TaxID=38038 RepID=A0A1E1M9F1_RHYSE|nr:uncharacterized protein RSE6_05603 [Rhynchosporium secalis]
MYLPESLHQANQDRKKSLLYTCMSFRRYRKETYGN